MSDRSDAILVWVPRVLGILVCLFLSLFALDAFDEGGTLLQSILGFLIHVAPMAALLVVVLLSWRWPWLGGVVFSVLAIAYAFYARGHLDWIPVVSGPLLVVGVLFLWSWARRRGRRAIA